METRSIYTFLACLVIGYQFGISAQNQVSKGKKINRTPEQFMERQTHQMVKTLMLGDVITIKFVPVYQSYLKELRECKMMNRKRAPARRKVEKPRVKSESKLLLTDAKVE